MSAYNLTLQDKNGDEVYPKTLEENVYDSGGNRLDQKLSGMQDNIASLQIGTLSGGYVNIASYTSSNKYTTPFDGYLWISCPLNSVGTVYIQSAGTYAGTFSHTCYNGAASSEFGNSLFIKKGMKLWVTSNTNATIRFFPLM